MKKKFIANIILSIVLILYITYSLLASNGKKMLLDLPSNKIFVEILLSICILYIAFYLYSSIKILLHNRKSVKAYITSILTLILLLSFTYHLISII